MSSTEKVPKPSSRAALPNDCEKESSDKLIEELERLEIEQELLENVLFLSQLEAEEKKLCEVLALSDLEKEREAQRSMLNSSIPASSNVAPSSLDKLFTISSLRYIFQIYIFSLIWK